jgi:RNA polymerase sigma factor (TIGR02999 family)
MVERAEQDITKLLNDLRTGDKAAESRLIPLVYRELHARAFRFMRNERAGHTLQPSALVNEAYIRLIAGPKRDWKNRAHFFGVATQVMRHVLTDYARQRLAQKRGAALTPIAIDDVYVTAPNRLEELLVLEDALQVLGELDPRVLQVVTFRIYGGLGIEEIAEILQLSPRTIKRDWSYGQAWLKAELAPKKSNAAKRL